MRRMGTVRAACELVISAPPEQVYQALADYRTTRPALLPTSYSDYRVEAGGEGAGTVVRYHLSRGGRERDYRMRVTEASAPRRLVEADEDSTFTTVWELAAAGAGTRVRVDSSWAGASGVGGFFERTFAPRALRRLQAETLRNLAEHVSRG